MKGLCEKYNEGYGWSSADSKCTKSASSTESSGEACDNGDPSGKTAAFAETAGLCEWDEDLDPNSEMDLSTDTDCLTANAGATWTADVSCVLEHSEPNVSTFYSQPLYSRNMPAPFAYTKNYYIYAHL
jgi:hypothetical protein